MDVRRLKLFLAVVDQGGFTKAAEAELLSQSAVSQAIRELERELGSLLFNRAGARATLTAAGTSLIPPARLALQALEKCEAAVKEVEGMTVGRLAVSAMPGLSIDPLPRLVGAFRTAFPGVITEISAPENASELLAEITSGRVELGITYRGSGSTSLVAHELTIVEAVAVFPPGADAPPAVRVDELPDLPLIATPGTHDFLKRVLPPGSPWPSFVVRCTQLAAVPSLVLAGAGVGLLARSTAEVGRLGGAVLVPFEPAVENDVVVVHRNAPLSPAARRFLEIAEADPRNGHP